MTGTTGRGVVRRGEQRYGCERVKRWEAQCIQEQAPACNAACPVHVDARGLLECVRKGDFKRGLKIFANSIFLPQIVARICDHPVTDSVNAAKRVSP